MLDRVAAPRIAAHPETSALRLNPDFPPTAASGQEQTFTADAVPAIGCPLSPLIGAFFLDAAAPRPRLFYARLMVICMLDYSGMFRITFAPGAGNRD